MPRLTVKGLAALKPGRWASDGGARGGGVLAARRAGAAVLFYFRYVRPDGTRDKLPMGAWDAAGETGLSLDDARSRAGVLSRRYRANERDLRAVLEQEERLASEARELTKRDEQAKQAKRTLTLGALLDAYTDALRAAGKPSAASVAKSLQRHVRDAFPALWATPATEVDGDAVLPVLGRLTAATKLREAAKVRSYLRSAFSRAATARTNPNAPDTLRQFAIKVNPLRDLGTIEGATGQRDRALSVPELQAYWRRILALPDPYGALLQFHLLTGGQRCQQLQRLVTKDLDDDAKAVMLRDTKGRRERPRKHFVPLVPAAREALDRMGTPRAGDYLFTVSNGATGAVYHTVAAIVREVAKEMIKAGEASKSFTPGDLRRTVETRLAAAGVSPIVRAHLQSHGLGGIQAAHYDRHDYFDEKRHALETLEALLTKRPAKVVRLKRG